MNARLAFRTADALRTGPTSSPADDDEVPSSYVQQAIERLAAKHKDEIDDLAAVLWLADQRELRS